MSDDAPKSAQEEVAPPQAAQQPAWRLWVGRGARSVARLWVVGLLVAAAIVSGMALNQVFQAEQQLKALRQEPGPDAYALVAYRQELERQLEAYRRGRIEEATPTPPPRPLLLEEIDIARARNRAVVQPDAAGGGGGVRGTTPVIAAPE